MDRSASRFYRAKREADFGFSQHIGSTFEAASPAALFQIRIVTGLAALQTQYAVSRDGRFLINTQVDESNTTPITLILNWKPKP